IQKKFRKLPCFTINNVGVYKMSSRGAFQVEKNYWTNSIQPSHLNMGTGLDNSKIYLLNNFSIFKIRRK
ncbi:MAG: hypothetical protein ACTSQI_20625, partial [Candidatus Helarchaeota archaeon]